MTDPSKDPLPYVPYEDHLMDVEAPRRRGPRAWVILLVPMGAWLLWLVMG